MIKNTIIEEFKVKMPDEQEQIECIVKRVRDFGAVDRDANLRNLD